MPLAYAYCTSLEYTPVSLESQASQVLMPSALQTPLIRRNIVTRSQTVWLVLGSAFVLALAWGTPGVYAHGGDPTLIHSCVANNNGNVRIVGADTSCRNNEIAVDWPGTSATPGQGSIMFHSIGAISGIPSVPVCLPPGGAFTCAYRSPRDGTIQNIRVLIDSNTFSGPAIVTIFVNGISTLLSTTIPAGSTSDIDVPGVVDILDGDRISVMMDISAVTVNGGLIRLTVSYEIK
jgi:hypothetical protein